MPQRSTAQHEVLQQGNLVQEPASVNKDQPVLLCCLQSAQHSMPQHSMTQHEGLQEGNLLQEPAMFDKHQSLHYYIF